LHEFNLYSNDNPPPHDVKTINKNVHLIYLNLFGNLILNKFSLPYLMIRLGDDSSIYDDELKYILIGRLIKYRTNDYN